MSDLWLTSTRFNASHAEIGPILKDNGERRTEFGVPFLDDCLRGIACTDLIIVSAASGAGKSEVSWHMGTRNAQANLKKGQKVVIFALESEWREVEMRQRYKVLATLYFRDKHYAHSYINYPDFYYGKLDDVFAPYNDMADKILESLSENVFVRAADSSYTIKQFEIDFENANGASLIVLDHLHFLQIGDENENKAYKAAVTKIRELILKHKIPVLAVTQLRKDSQFNRQASVMPDISDVYGSSDIFKLATKAIMFAGAGDTVTSTNPKTERLTLVRAVKNRLDGSVKAYTGLLSYDFSTNTYKDRYVVGSLKWEKNPENHKLEEKFRPLEDKPQWFTERKD